MKDSRVTLWTNPTAINVDGTITGPTLDLFPNGVAGDHLAGAGKYGLGVHVQLVNIAGTAFNVVVTAQESSDDSNWYEIKTLYTGDPVADVVGTKITIEDRLEVSVRYVRLKAVATNIAGADACNMNAWVADGTPRVTRNIRYA